MNCEMCGKDTQLFVTEIEGTKLKLCQLCGKFGKVISRVKTEESPKKQTKIEEKTEAPIVEEIIVKDFGQRIKKSREKRGLSQEDFAKMLNEKESVIHHLESGKYELSIDLARKLERKLGIKLIDVYDSSSDIKENRRAEPKTLTLGDIAIVKRKK